MNQAKRFHQFLYMSLAPFVLLSPLVLAGQNAEEISRKYQETKEVLLENDAARRRVLGSLYSVTQRMKKITREKGQLTDELIHVQAGVKSVARRIAGLEGQIKQQRLQVKKRLRALYKLSGEGFVGVIFSQASVSEIDHALRFLKIITEQDYRLIESYRQNIEDYKVQKLKLKEQVHQLMGLEKKIKKKEEMILAEHQQKSKIVSQLDKTHRDHLKKMRDLRQRSKDLRESQGDDRSEISASRWSELLKPSIFEKKGQLSAPLRGQVVGDFGLMTMDRYKIQLSHKGWRYAAPLGTPVHCIFDGKVVLSEWVSGYGHTIILDHGDHYYSVYSQLVDLQVSLGDQIKGGQVMARSGGATRRHPGGIYFEIRHFSEPENPSSWMAPQDFKISKNNNETAPLETASLKAMPNQEPPEEIQQ